MSKIRLQGPDNFGGLTHDGNNYTPDEDGIIEVPAHLPTEVLAAHGLKAASVKTAPKPLAKSAKGGDKDGAAGESSGDGSGKPAEADEGKDAKPAQKGAKSAKGGAE